MENQKLFEVLESIAQDPTFSEHDKARILQNLAKLKETKVNLLITGPTGAGKSSTINALFNTEKAKVGVGVDPETMHIQKYELNNIILWDSPGLGDGKAKDEQHAKGIISKLLEKDSKGDLLIDLVLVVLEGKSRDFGTAYQLINEVIIPNLGEDKSRLLVAINQADVAMNGRGWDDEKNEPLPQLRKFLEEKVESTRRRIKEATGVDTTPIYYAAGFKDEFGERLPYNLSKLLAFILRHTKEEKRAVFADEINREAKLWEQGEDSKKYQEEIKKSFIESTLENLGKGLGKVVEEGILRPLSKAADTVMDVVDSLSSAAKSIGNTVRSWLPW